MSLIKRRVKPAHRHLIIQYILTPIRWSRSWRCFSWICNANFCLFSKNCLHVGHFTFFPGPSPSNLAPRARRCVSFICNANFSLERNISPHVGHLISRKGSCFSPMCSRSSFWPPTLKYQIRFTKNIWKY